MGSVTSSGLARSPAGSRIGTRGGSAAAPGPVGGEFSGVLAGDGGGGAAGEPAGLAGLVTGEDGAEDAALALRRRRFSPVESTGLKPSSGGEAGGEGVAGISDAGGMVAPGGVPVVFSGLGTGGEASGDVSPWAGGVFSGVFVDCMVAGGVSVGLVLKPLIFFVRSSTRGFSTS